MQSNALKTIKFKLTTLDNAIIRAKAKELAGGGRYLLECNLRIGTLTATGDDRFRTFNTAVLEDDHDLESPYKFADVAGEMIEVDETETITLDLPICTNPSGTPGEWEICDYIHPTWVKGELVSIKTNADLLAEKKEAKKALEVSALPSPSPEATPEPEAPAAPITSDKLFPITLTSKLLADIATLKPEDDMTETAVLAKIREGKVNTNVKLTEAEAEEFVLIADQFTALAGLQTAKARILRNYTA